MGTIKKMIHKRRSLFKNDPLGIKRKCFVWRLERHMKKGTEVRTKALRAYVSIINRIGIPQNVEATELLRKVVKSYDDIIAELEQSVKYARMYIREGGMIDYVFRMAMDSYSGDCGDCIHLIAKRKREDELQKLQLL